MTIASNGVLNIVPGGGYGLDSLILTNYGTVNWTNTTIYDINTNNSQIYNYGVWDAQSDSLFVGGYYGGTPSSTISAPSSNPHEHQLSRLRR